MYAVPKRADPDPSVAKGGIGKKWSAYIIGAGGMFFVLGMLLAPQVKYVVGQSDSRKLQGVSSASSDVFHLVPRSPLPTTVSPEAFRDPELRTVYGMAAEIRPVLDQLPCSCSCARELGHGSLLDCYVNRHASRCEVCQLEAVFAYQATVKGETPSQIRAEIALGDWRTVNLEKARASLRRMIERRDKRSVGQFEK